VQYGLRPETITTTETDSDTDEMKSKEINKNKSNTDAIKKKNAVTIHKNLT
jgi:hypothetical protein